MIPVGSGKRLKGWQATPLRSSGKRAGLEVAVLPVEGGDSHFAALGFGLREPVSCRIAQGERALLTQEVRNPRAGRYVFSVHANGGGSSAAYFRAVFLKHFTCRLSIFGYTDLQKNPLSIREFAKLVLTPTFAQADAGPFEKVELTASLRSQDNGAFELSRGVGVAISVEKTSPGGLEVANGEQAFLRIDDVEMKFIPRPRDETVMV